MAKGKGSKSKPTKEISEITTVNETFEHEHKKRKINLTHEGSQTDESLEKNLQMAEIDGNVFQIDAELTQQKKIVEKLNALVQEQQEQLDQEKRFRSAMNARLNDLEQYSRKNNLRIFGILDKDRKETSAKTEQLVLKLFKEKLGILWINANNIEIAHRTGRFVEGSNRPIIVKLTSRKVKNEVILNRKKLKGKNISIAEDLTIENVKRLRMLNSLEVCTSSWSFDGKLFIKNKHDEKIEVRSSDHISEDIFLTAAQRRTATNSESSKNQLKEKEQSKPIQEKHPSQPKEGEITTAEKNNTAESTKNACQTSNDLVTVEEKKSETKDSRNTKSANNHDTACAKSPSSKKDNISKNGDSSADSPMEIADVMNDTASKITPQHSSTPRQDQDDRIKKIAAHQEAIDIRLRLLAGEKID